LFLISLIISVEACDITAEFQVIPLPSRRELWEANSRSSWEREYNLILADPESRQLCHFGDLLRLQQPTGTEEATNLHGLDEWNTGMDGLGMLITMATAMISFVE
jgi:hypothetical protein